MKKVVRGNTVGTTTPRPNFDQDNSKKADYILNRPLDRLLPSVTADDDFKIPIVKDGKWTLWDKVNTPGITPRLKIDEITKEWLVSYDNGITWESLGEPVGIKLVDNGDGDFFAVITQTDGIEATDVEMINDGKGNVTIVGTQKNEGHVATLPQLYAPSISINGDTVTITDNKNSFFVTAYKIYINGVYKSNVTNKSFNAVDVVESGTSANITVTAIGEGFGITFKESKPSNAVEFINEPIAEAKEFTLSGFGHTSPNGDNTFNFDEGMTWGEWKESEYNRFTYANYDDGFVYRFATMNNGYTDIDVACCPDTPIEGICYADGTPVKDDEIIKEGSGNYYLADADEYDPSSSGDDYEDLPTFDIGFPDNSNSTYRVREGMTWAEWVASDYNTDGFINDGTDIVFPRTYEHWDTGEYCYYGVNSGGTVSPDDEIEVGASYDFEILDNYTPIITFYIGSTAYRAKEGMTFGEWCNSSYDHGSWYVYEVETDLTRIIREDYDGINSNGLETISGDGYIGAEDVIVAGHNYDCDSNW